MSLPFRRGTALLNRQPKLQARQIRSLAYHGPDHAAGGRCWYMTICRTRRRAHTAYAAIAGMRPRQSRRKKREQAPKDSPRATQRNQQRGAPTTAVWRRPAMSVRPPTTRRAGPQEMAAPFQQGDHASETIKRSKLIFAPARHYGSSRSEVPVRGHCRRHPRCLKPQYSHAEWASGSEFVHAVAYFRESLGFCVVSSRRGVGPHERLVPRLAR